MGCGRYALVPAAPVALARMEIAKKRSWRNTLRIGGPRRDMQTQQEPVPGVLAPGTAQLVEAGGQHFRGFRRGLDYAFIHALKERGCGACYPARQCRRGS